MDADTGAVRQLAEELTERAEEIRAHAARLARRIAEVPWEGLAADAMRLQARLRLAGLSYTADLHDDAAEALTRHAAAVDTTLGLVDDLVDGLVDRTIGLFR